MKKKNKLFHYIGDHHNLSDTLSSTTPIEPLCPNTL